MYLDKVFIKHPNICLVPEMKLVCVFPFPSRKSLEIKRWLQNAIERALPYWKLKFIFKSPSKTVNHFHFEDVLPKKLCYYIVYFKCNSCNAIYNGKAKGQFYVRAAKHMEISHLTNKRLENIKQSAISDHLLTCDCNISFNDFKKLRIWSHFLKKSSMENFISLCSASRALSRNKLKGLSKFFAGTTNINLNNSITWEICAFSYLFICFTTSSNDEKSLSLIWRHAVENWWSCCWSCSRWNSE